MVIETRHGDFTVNDIDRKKQKELYRQNRAVFWVTEGGSERYDILLDNIQEVSGLKEGDLGDLLQSEIVEVLSDIFQAYQGIDKKKV